MLKKSTRLELLLMIIVMLATSFVSCTNSKDPDKTNLEGAVSTIDAIDISGAFKESGLELRDFNNEKFNIWYSNASSWAPYPLKSLENEQMADIVFKAGYMRNNKIQEILNVELNYTDSPTNSNTSGENGDFAALNVLQKSGELNKFDMIMTGAKVAPSLAIQGGYYNLAESPYIKTGALYYESDVNQQLSFCKKQYFALGYYSVMNTAAIDVTYVNRWIIEAQKDSMDNIYGLVMDKKWTFEQMMTIGKKYITLDNDNGSNAQRYALIVSRNYCTNIFYDIGGTVVESSDDGYEVTINNRKNQDILTYIQNTLTNSGNVVFVKNDQHTKSFINQEAPFMTATFYNIWKVKDSAINYALVPTPTRNEGDDYKAYSDSWCLNVAGIPAQAADKDKSSYLYEAFMCLSFDYLYPAYFEKSFGLQYVNNTIEAKIFDILSKSRIICLANIYSWFGEKSVASMIHSGNTGVGSTVKVISAEVSANMNKAIIALEGLES